MNSIFIYTKTAAATRRIGQYIGKSLEAGSVVLLNGPLGSGKTTLTQGIARGLGISGSVMSPTFVLMRELKGRLPMYHLDLYRLENLPEISDLGLDDYLYGDGVTVVEWADRAGVLLPEDYLKIELGYDGYKGRRLEFTALNEGYAKLLLDIDARFGVKA
ncbi:ATPase YjeE [Dehalogenimonas sp. WBC-2]|nr:ATPase YjeE [Dehalogenimonas sp. WBC-2]